MSSTVSRGLYENIAGEIINDDWDIVVRVMTGDGYGSVSIGVHSAGVVGIGVSYMVFELARWRKDRVVIVWLHFVVASMKACCCREVRWKKSSCNVVMAVVVKSCNCRSGKPTL
ncbi:hypothetical protein C5167_042246 [Papaver somniferum]|uniref:Uncharacterized protein n=1 Tax=Papaver somniferum TaxID=3469 RepID=A0A4Y7L4W3_PAPSO|nr:hypothetical protein C5167_042246 [Papaver somniferum]